jgi:hypothetical protein
LVFFFFFFFLFVFKPHALGLNPIETRAYRSYYSSTSTNSQEDNLPIDAHLLGEFGCLPPSKRRELAKKIGTHQKFVFKSALEIEFSSCFF